MSAIDVQVMDGKAHMTEQRMQEILRDAAVRLQGQETTLTLKAPDSAPHTSLPRLDASQVARPYTVAGPNGIAQIQAVRRSDENPSHATSIAIRKVEDPIAVKANLLKKRKASAGAKWYDLPKTNLTTELKRDLQLLKMRNVLDPHRHYKKDNGKLKAPEYSQVGTIVEGPTEFFSARLQNRDRKETLVEEVLGGEQQSGRFKRKYGDIQVAKTSGKKAYYKVLKSKRAVSHKKR